MKLEKTVSQTEEEKKEIEEIMKDENIQILSEKVS